MSGPKPVELDPRLLSYTLSDGTDNTEITFG